jgi:hypothetical protein
MVKRELGSGFVLRTKRVTVAHFEHTHYMIAVLWFKAHVGSGCSFHICLHNFRVSFNAIDK